MPTSVIVAVGAALASAGAAGIVGGGIAGTIIGAIAGAAVSYGISHLIAGNGKTPTNTLKSVNTSIREPAAARDLVYGRVRKGGVITFMGNPVSTELHMVFTIAGHEIDAIEAAYFNSEKVTFDASGYAQGRYLVGSAAFPPGSGGGSYALQETNLGTTTQAAFPYLVASSSGKWTSSHQQLGCAGVHIAFGWNADIYAQGIPNVSFLIRGKKVYDPRTGLTVWSNNAALCVADYLCDSTYGLGYSYNDIDSASLIAAANVCDESVSLAAGGTESRYTIDGVVSSAQTPEQVLTDMLLAMAGNASFTGGKWYIWAGAYTAPTDGIDEDDLRGAISLTSRRSRRDTFNGVKGTFLNPSDKYQQTDYPAYASSTYYAEDGNERKWLDMDLPFTKSSTMAQRIVKIALERNRRQIDVVMPCKLSAYRFQPGKLLTVTNTQLGWNSKVFEVVGSNLTFDMESGLGVDLELKEIDSNVFVWSSAEDVDAPAAPTTDLPDPWTVGAPGAPSFTETMYETTGSAGVKTKLVVSWMDSDDVQVSSGGQYQLEYKLSTDTTYVVIHNIRATSVEIFDMVPGTYNFRVKAINTSNVSSAYSSTTYTVVGLGAAPTNVQSFSVRAASGLAHFTWAKHADLDVRIGGVIEIRHSNATTPTLALWSDSALIDRYDGNSVFGVGPLILGYYLAKARDSSLIYSNSAAVFAADEALVSNYTSVGSVCETNSSFVNSKTNLTFGSGILALTDPAVSSRGTYYFPGSPGYNAGSSTNRRLESDMNITRFDVADAIDTRASVDTWSSVDGGAVDQGEVLLYVRTTKNDPRSAAAIWGDWTPFRVSEFQFWGAQFKLEFASEQATQNIGVTSMAIVFKV